MTTPADIGHHLAGGSWRALERFAFAVVEDAAMCAKTDFKPLLGGGTRLMLAMQHRISDDIDLFIRDPQWIGYLTPRLNDYIEEQIDAFDKGATSLKIKLPTGEINLSVSISLLGLEPETSNNCLCPLEPVSEVLAKKLFYRGWALTPRELFDWWCLEHLLPPELAHTARIADLVTGRIATLAAALKQMSTSSSAALVWASIRTPSLPDLQVSIAWAQQRLVDFQSPSASRASGTSV